MGSQGPGGALRRVETEAIGAGVKPRSDGKTPPGKRTTASWVNQLIDQEVRAGRLKVTPSQRRRLAETMQGLGPDRLQRLIGTDASEPLVRRLEILAEAEGEKPTKRSGGDPISRALKAFGAASLSVQEKLGLPTGGSPQDALRRVEAVARREPSNPSPNLGGPPGTRLPSTVNDMTATREQGEHMTVVHPVAGNNRGQLVKESQAAIADEAQQKLLAGQDLSPEELSALASQSRLGLNPKTSTDKDLRTAQFAGTGIITGYQVQPRMGVEGSEGGERIRKPGIQGTPNEAGTNTGGKQAVIKTVAQLEDELSDKSPAEIKALQQRLKDANLLPQGASVSGYVDGDTIKAYDTLLQEVANYQAHYRDLTPDQYLDKKIAGIKAGGGGKTSTSTNTTTSVNLTDPITAKGYITGSMRQLLGRMPTAGEVNGFVSSLNAAERANPQVTTTTSTSTQNAAGDNTNTNTSSTSSGGIGSGSSFGDDFIMQSHMPELRASNAVQFYDLALQALKSPVSI